MTHQEGRSDESEAADHQNTSTTGATQDTDACNGTGGYQAVEDAWWGDLPLAPQHVEKLKSSGISAGIAAMRSYRTVYDERELRELCFAESLCHPRHMPVLLIPQMDVRRMTVGYQCRPDNPRETEAGKVIKYESQTRKWGPRPLDFAPETAALLDDPTEMKWITEGSLKADALSQRGMAAISLPGVAGWRSTNQHNGKVAHPDLNDVAIEGSEFVIAYDSDVASKKEVRAQMVALGNYLHHRRARRVFYLHLPDAPDGGKQGVDDYLAAGYTKEDLLRLVRPELPPLREDGEQAEPEPEPEPEPVEPITLDEAHKVFHRWLGKSYDTDALDIMLTPPPWNARRRPGVADADLRVREREDRNRAVARRRRSHHHLVDLVGRRAAVGHIQKGADTRRDRRDAAPNRRAWRAGHQGRHPILSMDRNARAEVLAALREIYDGRWERNVGTDGGKTLRWRGRLAVIGACTTAWDKAHAVISVMGDRFVLVRIDSENEEGREESGLQSILNLGSETQMRQDLANAVAGVIAGMTTNPPELDDAERLLMVRVATLVTKARTAVDFDYRGNVEGAHAPEAPARFAKQLAQIVRGASAIGAEGERALKLAVRCARDSVPPLRLAILDDLGADHPDSTALRVAERIDKPRTSVDRQLQALHALGLARVKPGSSPWNYTLTAGVNPKVLDLSSVPEMLVKARRDIGKRETGTAQGVCPATHISGRADEPPPSSFGRPIDGQDADRPPPVNDFGELRERLLAAHDAKRAAPQQPVQPSANGQRRPPNPHDPRLSRSGDPAKKKLGRHARKKTKR